MELVIYIILTILAGIFMIITCYRIEKSEEQLERIKERTRILIGENVILTADNKKLKQEVEKYMEEIKKHKSYAINGKLIKQARIKKQMTQKMLANKLGISTSYLQMFEQEKTKKAGYSLAKKIEDVLGINLGV